MSGDAPSCWICLEEGPDQSGKPLVRNCSCRGASGFSHVSCIITNAKTKTIEIEKSKVATDNYMEAGPPHLPWQSCPNCCQYYQGDLLLELVDAYLLFTKESAPYDGHIEGIPVSMFEAEPMRWVDALYFKMNVDCVEDEDRKEIALQIISCIDTLKAHSEEMKMIGYTFSQLRPPPFTPPPQLKMYSLLTIEMWTLLQLGTMYEHSVLRGNFNGAEREEGLSKALEYYEKSRKVASSLPGQEVIRWGEGHSDVKIARIKAQLHGDIGPMESLLPYLREVYRYKKDTNSGIELMNALNNTKRGIEARRLILELIKSARRLHGENHEATRRVEKIATIINICKVVMRSEGVDAIDVCKVVMRSEGADAKITHKALHYDGDKLVVTQMVEDRTTSVAEKEDNGKELRPMAQSEKALEQCLISLEQDEYTICLGTPVICHGLVKANHLNGEIGDVRSYDKNSRRYEVHFEDKSLKPSLVRHQNVRIVFDLSEDKDESYDDVD